MLFMFLIRNIDCNTQILVIPKSEKKMGKVTFTET